VKVQIIFISSDKKVKGEVPAHAVKVYRGGGGMAPLILKVGNIEMSGQFYAPVFLGEETPVKPQSRSGRFG
jgi:hypothetical protein